MVDNSHTMSLTRNVLGNVGDVVVNKVAYNNCGGYKLQQL